MPQILNLRNKNKEAPLGVPVADSRPDETATMPPATKKEWSGVIDQEHFHTDKRLVIYFGLGFTALGLLYTLVWKNIIAAILFFLIVVVLIIMTFKEKKSINWKADHRGVTVDASYFPFSELKSFWIEYRPGQMKELSFRSKKWHYSFIKIPLDKENPLALRKFLLDFLPEEKHEDTIVETLTRKLGM